MVNLPRSLGKQIKFAMSQALNDSAFAILKAINSSLPRHFTLRRTHTAKGTRVTKANKRTLIAQVGTTRDYLEDHVTGGTRTRPAIPTRNLRRNPRRVIGRSRWPGALRGGQFFLIDSRKARGRLGRRSRGAVKLLYRRGKGRRRTPRLLWTVPKVQPVKPRWPFLNIVAPVHQREFTRAFPGRLVAALRTAKP